MSERTLVPIFVFWAILTIITPTLVLLSSENSKLDHLNGFNKSEEVKDGRIIMMSHQHDDHMKNDTTKMTPNSNMTKSVTTVTTVVAAAEDQLAQTTSLSAPAPISMVNLTTSYDDHNGTNYNSVRSNKSSEDEGVVRLVSLRKHLKQTKMASTSI